MTVQETVALALRDIEPMLAAGGRSVRVTDSNETSCTIELAGFCSGCACGESYMSGIEDVIRERVPEIKTIEFVLV